MLQALFFFLSLSRCSLPVVLSWVTVVPHIIQALLDAQLNKSQMQPGRLAGLLLGIVATGGLLVDLARHLCTGRHSLALNSHCGLP